MSWFTPLRGSKWLARPVRVEIAVCCLAILTIPVHGAEAPKTTVVVHSPDRVSAVTLQEMRDEVGRQLARLAEVSWRDADGVRDGESLLRPVQVRFRGECLMRRAPVGEMLPGPYAWTHVSDGRVLPFVEVDCNRVRESILSVMWGEDFQHRDLLLGRALGRVIAHEMHHVLLRTVDHPTTGVAKHSLRADELIRGEALPIGGS